MQLHAACSMQLHAACYMQLPAPCGTQQSAVTRNNVQLHTLSHAALTPFTFKQKKVSAAREI